jgi:hypothetical protein
LKQTAPAFAVGAMTVGFVDNKMARTDKLHIFLKIFGLKAARAEFITMILFVSEKAVQKQVNLFLIWIHPEFVLGRQGLNSLKKSFSVYLSGKGLSNPDRLGCANFHVGVLRAAGWADFWWLIPHVDILTDETSPAFFHLLSLSS